MLDREIAAKGKGKGKGKGEGLNYAGIEREEEEHDGPHDVVDQDEHEQKGSEEDQRWLSTVCALSREAPAPVTRP